MKFYFRNLNQFLFLKFNSYILLFHQVCKAASGDAAIFLPLTMCKSDEKQAHFSHHKGFFDLIIC